jgi:hypothetical protein
MLIFRRPRVVMTMTAVTDFKASLGAKLDKGISIVCHLPGDCRNALVLELFDELVVRIVTRFVRKRFNISLELGVRVFPKDHDRSVRGNRQLTINRESRSPSRRFNLAPNSLEDRCTIRKIAVGIARTLP